MGFFSSAKKISFNDLEGILRDVTSLSTSEREYVRGVFSQYRSTGITKRSIELATQEMKRNGSDNIGRSEAGQVQDALLETLNAE